MTGKKPSCLAALNSAVWRDLSELSAWYPNLDNPPLFRVTGIITRSRPLVAELSTPKKRNKVSMALRFVEINK